MGSKNLMTAGAVFEALGGVKAVAALVGAKYPTVHHWKRVGSFPPKTYDAMTRALAERGLAAPVALWRMVEAA